MTIFDKKLDNLLEISPNYGQMIVLEGLIGAGKSTETEKIQKQYPYVKIFKEPVDHPIISKLMPIFYGYLAGENNERSVCFTFQEAWLTIRCQMHKEACRLVWEEKATCVFDRSVYGDASFAHNLNGAGHITDTEFAIYMAMRNYLTSQLYIPHKFIWLDLEVKETMRRIAKRDRPCERGITEEYLSGLLESYKEMVLKPFEEIGKVSYYTPPVDDSDDLQVSGS